MRQLRWGLKAEFPYTKVFFLGILLTVLGSACVVVSVVGIIKLAWGYYVSTGMWGGVAVTVSGLAAMYSARSQSSASARLYFLLSVAACVISFTMLVLSAGGLTYKSDFYRPVRFESDRHKVTLFLHSSVLSISVLSLACNLLSVIVCCKFMTREKESPESFKLRRHRRRQSDSNSGHRNSSLRASSGAARSSTNSRTPLFGSERARKHSRQGSGSDLGTNLKIPTERISHRRDSERSRGSSRSRQSHHRQSSSISQQSRQSGATDPAEVTTSLLRDSGHPNSLSGHQDGMSSRATRDNVRDSLADTVADSISEHLVFDPDEEPPPPYEERRPTGDSIPSTGDETDTETVVGSSSVVVPSYLPLNIPVTRIGGQLQMESLQRQPPPSGSRAASQQGRDGSAISSPNLSSELLDNCVSLMRMALTDDREEDDESQPQSEERSHSPEICALTGARLTPVAAIQPDTVGSNTCALMSCIQPSPGSSDTSIPGEISQLLAGQVPVSSRSQSMPVQTLSSSSPSAFTGGIRSPNSAFRPVGKGMMPSSSVPLHNFFSPISAPGSPHHTVYSPVASATANLRLTSNPASPRHTSTLIASSESLRGVSTQSSLWKKIPLPTSHNHSNKNSCAPTKEVISKNIPGPAQPVSSRDCDMNNDLHTHSLPRQSSKEATDSLTLEMRARTQFSSLPARNTSPKRTAGLQFATIPARNVKEVAPAITSIDRQHASRRSGENKSAGRRKGGVANNHSTVFDSGFTTLAKQSGATGNTDLRSQPGPADPVCRSAGIQATDDGGISSSMDRTHRWVLGTLPSGTQYQGVTRNLAHAHLTSSQGPRAATLGAVGKHGGRVHGAWNHPGPQVESSTMPSRSHASHTNRHDPIERQNKAAEPQRDPSFSSPKKSCGAFAPKPIRPNVADSAGNGSRSFSSPAKSQPIAPKPVRPVPVDNSGNGASHFAMPAKPQTVVPKPINPLAVNENTGAFSSPVKSQDQTLKPARDGEGAFSSPAKSHPLALDMQLGDAYGSRIRACPTQAQPEHLAVHHNWPADGTGNRPGAFSSLVKSQPLVPKAVRPGESVGNGTGAFSSPARPQPLFPNSVRSGDSIGNGGGAFSSLAKPQPLAPNPGMLGDGEGSGTGAFSSLAKPQPLAPKPVRPFGNGVGNEVIGSFLMPVMSHPLAPKPAETLGNGSGAFSSLAKLTQPVSCKLPHGIGNEGGGELSAFSCAISTSSHPAAPKPVKPIPAERTSKAACAPVANSSASLSSSLPSANAQTPLSVSMSTTAKDSALSPSSRLPRYQHGHQNTGEELAAVQQQQPLLHQLSLQPTPQQPQALRAPVIPPRAPPQPQPVQRQRQLQPLQPHLVPGPAVAGQNPNQQPDKPLFSVLL